MADDIVSLVRRLHAELVRTGGSAWNDVADEIERLRQAERALADQLASALRSVVHDRPTAHSDAVWNQCLEALEAHQEARRG